jgi:outer membrane protein assembly factor BamB
MSNNPFRKVACPSCGAPLWIDPNAESTRCTFCGSVVERAEPMRKPPPPKPEEPRPYTPPSLTIPFEKPAPSPSRVFRFIILFLSIILATGFGALIIFTVVSVSSPPLSILGTAALLDYDPASPPDVIALGFDIPSDTYRLARLDPVRHRAAWRGKTFEDISDVSGIVADGKSFFTVEGSDLHAYSVQDGSALWQTALPDKLGYCSECLTVIGSRVIVLTQDYTLQAYDSAGGKLAWTRRLAGYTRGFWIVEDTLLVIDKAEGRGEYSLLQLNLSDGTAARQIDPECQFESDYSTEHLDGSSAVLPDLNSAETVYLIYGYYPGCIERWDLSRGERVWQSVDEDGYSPSNDYSILFTEDTLYFAYEHSLWAADTASGRTRLVAQPEDYELVPIAQAGGRLIARAKRTRGTAQYGLWGMDPAAGEKIWQYVFTTGAPLDPPDGASGLVDSDQSAWTFRLAGEQLIVLEFTSQPNRMRITALDPQTGNASDEKTIKLKGEDDYFIPTILGWRDPIFWTIIDSEIYGIDIGAGKISYRYP